MIFLFNYFVFIWTIYFYQFSLFRVLTSVWWLDTGCGVGSSVDDISRYTEIRCPIRCLIMYGDRGAPEDIHAVGEDVDPKARVVGQGSD